MDDGQPRHSLDDGETALLRWLLPAGAPGYRAVLERILGLSILGHGRWGDGDYLLGEPGGVVDLSGPMERIFAHGVVEHGPARRTVTVHEEAGGQIEIQFSVHGDEHDATLAPETRRYSWSEWRPGQPSPRARGSVREIPLPRPVAGAVPLFVIAPGDEKLWLHDPATGVNHLIPHTGFYNELMRAARIRDAQRVFAPKLLFTEHARYGDAEFLTAFARYSAAYNIFRTSVFSPAAPPQRRTWLNRLIARTQ
jgi:hypothetical protein